MVKCVFFLKLMRVGGFGEWHHPVDSGFQFSFGEPAINVVGAFPLFCGSCLKHDKTMERTALDVERADRELGPCVSSSHQNYTTALGKTIDGDNLHHAYKSHLKRANLPTISFHALRHSAASLR